MREPRDRGGTTPAPPSVMRVFWFPLALSSALVLASACTSTDDSINVAGAACEAAGGACVGAGGDVCANRAASTIDDCNAQEFPSGSFCCIGEDAGSRDAARSDAASDAASDAGQLCQSHGGTCVESGCSTQSSSVIDDCNPQGLPSGSICCLPPGDTLPADASASPGQACQSAGGTCLATGGQSCANLAPSQDDDCNPQRTPAGSFCCLSADASTD